MGVNVVMFDIQFEKEAKSLPQQRPAVIHPFSPSDQGNRTSGFLPLEKTRSDDQICILAMGVLWQVTNM